MNRKIITIDIVVMAIIVLFFIIFIATTGLKFTHYGYYLLALFRVPYYGYYLFLMYIYTFLKSVFGIIILIKRIRNKDKIIHSKKYLLCLSPIIIMAISYICFIYLFIISQINSARGIDVILTIFFSIPISKGFNIWFPLMNGNIIFSIAIIIGILMWLIYWVFYQGNISKMKLIILNIITPISMTILYFEILLQFSK